MCIQVSVMTQERTNIIKSSKNKYESKKRNNLSDNDTARIKHHELHKNINLIVESTQPNLELKFYFLG